jgi:transcriptional regulator with XRE-family HTH domain
MVNLTPEACRAARGLLDLSARELAERSGISAETIIKFENGRPMRESNKARLVELFALAGVEILNGNAPGARRRVLYAYEYDRGDGTWGVFVKHFEGAPGQGLSVEEAATLADKIEASGDVPMAAEVRRAMRLASGGAVRAPTIDDDPSASAPSAEYLYRRLAAMREGRRQPLTISMSPEAWSGLEGSAFALKTSEYGLLFDKVPVRLWPNQLGVSIAFEQH